MNTTMRARSKHAAWKPLLEDDQAWLRNIPFKLDIMQAEEKDWVTANGDALLSQAIATQVENSLICRGQGCRTSGTCRYSRTKRTRMRVL